MHDPSASPPPQRQKHHHPRIFSLEPPCPPPPLQTNSCYCHQIQLPTLSHHIQDVPPVGRRLCWGGAYVFVIMITTLIIMSIYGNILFLHHCTGCSLFHFMFLVFWLPSIFSWTLDFINCSTAGLAVSCCSIFNLSLNSWKAGFPVARLCCMRVCG